MMDEDEGENDGEKVKEYEKGEKSSSKIILNRTFGMMVMMVMMMEGNGFIVFDDPCDTW